MKDKKIRYLVEQIERGNLFTKTECPRGDTLLPLIVLADKKANGDKKNTLLHGRRGLLIFHLRKLEPDVRSV